MSAFPTGEGHSGATNPPNPGETSTPSGNDGSGDLGASSTSRWIEALAAELEPEAFDDTVPAESGWREATRNQALGHAAKVFALGLRRVVEDDTTVRSVAEALAGVDGWTIAWPAEGQQLEPMLVRYLAQARAAVRALREDTP